MGSPPGSKTQGPSEHIHLLTTVSLSSFLMFPSVQILFLTHSCSLFFFLPWSFLNESLTKQNHGENTKIFQLQQLWLKCSNSDNFNTNPFSFHTWYLIEIQRSCRARQLPRALQQGLIDREHIFKQTPQSDTSAF